jgi:hypothetical protein
MLSSFVPSTTNSNFVLGSSSTPPSTSGQHPMTMEEV